VSEGREATLSASMIVAGENDRQRFDEGELRALAEDIRHQGCLQRPIVRQTGPQRYQLIAGERRVRAMRDILKMGGIPVLIVDVDDDTAADMMLSENLSRVDLTPLEEARAFAKAIARGLSAVEVGRRHGVAPARITRRLLLLELDPSVAEGLDVGAIPLWAAETIAQLDHNRQRIATSQLIANPGMSPETLRLVVSRLIAERDQDAMFDPADFALQVETWDRAAKRGRALAKSQPVVGRSDIPALLGVAPARVYKWHERGQLPAPDFEVNGQPAWLTPKILQWAATDMPQHRYPRKTKAQV